MATHYAEFDSNSQSLMADIRAQILTSTDWSRLTGDTVLLNLSGATVATATVLNIANTAGSGLAIGSIIMIDDGANREYRSITAITGTTITVAALTFPHAAGAPIRKGNEVYKATTTRGADMIIDLMDTALATTGFSLGAACYVTHDGNVGTGKTLRYLFWRNNAGLQAHPLHVIVSVGKDHFFLSIEGPRVGETGAATTFGSLRAYIFMSAIEPYDPADTPVVFAGGSPFNGPGNAYSQGDGGGNVSKSLSGASLWSPAKLQTLETPKIGDGTSVSVQRQREVDGAFVLGPYVVFHDDTGMRGRLTSFHYAGPSYTDTPEAPVPPMGSKTLYQGQWYKLLPVSKGDGSRSSWAQFGSSIHTSSVNYARTPIVAVPCLP